MAKVACPQCGFANIQERNICKQCGADMNVTEPASSETISLEERKELLEKVVSQQQRAGWRVTDRTETSAQLVKDKGANALVTIILLILFILPGILYALLYKGTETIFIEVDEYGRVKRTQR